MSPPTAPGPSLQRAPLDVYKKVTIIRKQGDTVIYEDSQGRVQRINDLGDEALSATPALQPKVKLDIPVPTITFVDSYSNDVPANCPISKSFVRYTRPTIEESRDSIDYNADEDDENWLKSHLTFGSDLNGVVGMTKHSTADTNSGKESDSRPSTPIASGNISKKSKKNPSSKKDSNSTVKEKITKAPVINTSDGDSTDVDDLTDGQKLIRQRPSLPLPIFEQMLDILEKETAFETIITLSQAERLITNRIPQILQIFGSSSSAGPATKGIEKKRKKNSVTLRIVINDVYNYWVQKRSRLKKPLLRQYWPVTATNDTNPHLVFRPREKEKYKLRKKRQNDLDAFRKMKQLRIDFMKVRILLDLIKRREELNRCILDMQSDWFEQRIYDLVDTSGLPRESDRLSHEQIEQMLNIPKYFDTQNTDRGKKKKRKRSSGGKDNRSSPVPPSAQANPDSDIYQPDSTEAVAVAPQRIVASEENPPLFLHPLVSRESYATSWDNAVPFVSSYVNSHPTPTFRFRHRPRIGRGGRIVIDRLPRPGNPDLPPTNVFITGSQLPHVNDDSKPASRLLELLPKPLEYEKLSKRIEDIAASALSEEEENQSAQGRGGALPTSTAPDEENDGDEVLVAMSDWLGTDEQMWGEERFAIGPV